MSNQSPSPTPRTDAAEKAYRDWSSAVRYGTHEQKVEAAKNPALEGFDFARTLELDRARRLEEAQTYRAFWEKYALGSKLCPSCLMCGKQEHDSSRWAIKHLELPDIYICQACKERAEELQRRLDTKIGIRDYWIVKDKLYAAEKTNDMSLAAAYDSGFIAGQEAAEKRVKELEGK